MNRNTGYHSTLQVAGDPVQRSHVPFHHLTLHAASEDKIRLKSGRQAVSDFMQSHVISLC